MDNTPTRLGKPTLDKDLDKLTRLEEATHFISRGLLAPGIGLIFLALAMIVAAAFVIDRPGAAVIVAGAALAAYMAMNIGANDVTNNVGAAVGARAMSMGTALAIAAIFEIAGALLAGQGVAQTVASGIVDRAIFPNPDRRLLPGLYVRARLEQGVASSAILIPLAAVSRDPRGGATVYVVDRQGKAELRPKRLRPLRPDILADGPRAFPLAKEDIAEPRLALLLCPRIHAVAESA